MLTKPILKIIVPCYNEQDLLPVSCKEFKKIINDLIHEKLISDKSFILFVNDGSKDKTWDIIKELTNNNSIYSGISLANNRGHQTALLAGLLDDSREYDICVSADADCQDDLSVIKDMVLDWYNNKKIVYGVRKKRETDTVFKKYTARFFYKIMTYLGTNTIPDHADFRLLDRSIIEQLRSYPEHSIYFRGLFPNILNDNQTSIIYYNRKERQIGESKYSLKKMINLAGDGIVSMSNEPLNLIFKFSILFVFITAICILANIISVIMNHTNIIFILITTMMICTCIILIALSIIAQYIARINIETRNRPRYWINDKT